VGRICQQTFIDTGNSAAVVGFAKLSDVRTAITAADLLNDRGLPFDEEHGIPLCRVLTDRGSEYCGNPERHEYELYLAIENIDHSRTKTKSPQTNGICQRFHKTMLDEFYRIAFRKKLYRSLTKLQADLDQCSISITTSAPIRADAATAKRPCRSSLAAYPWPERS
jgi:transposase InsO family protein